MTAASYPHIIKEIKQLSMTDQLRLLEEMAVLIRERSTGVRTRSIFELKGRGKNIWKDIDAQKYIDEERASWTG